jgi:hypothetical protein
MDVKGTERTEPLQNVCSVKTILLKAYEEAAATYSAAVALLQTRMGQLSQAEYRTSYEKAESLRMRSRAAKEQLDRHVADHDC